MIRVRIASIITIIIIRKRMAIRIRRINNEKNNSSSNNHIIKINKIIVI